MRRKREQTTQSRRMENEEIARITAADGERASQKE
jgi:hypothetical protein